MFSDDERTFLVEAIDIMLSFSSHEGGGLGYDLSKDDIINLREKIEFEVVSCPYCGKDMKKTNDDFDAQSELVEFQCMDCGAFVQILGYPPAEDKDEDSDSDLGSTGEWEDNPGQEALPLLATH